MQKRKKYEKSAFAKIFLQKRFYCDKVTEKLFWLGYTNINENKLKTERI